MAGMLHDACGIAALALSAAAAFFVHRRTRAFDVAPALAIFAALGASLAAPGWAAPLLWGSALGWALSGQARLPCAAPESAASA